MARCDNCKWWERGEGGEGTCHRKCPVIVWATILMAAPDRMACPPAGTPVKDDETEEIIGSVPTSDRAIWPLTYQSDWCGDFEKIPQSTPISERLGVRVINCLKKLGIESLEEVGDRTAMEFLGVKGFGLSSLGRLEDFLESKGLPKPREH